MSYYPPSEGYQGGGGGSYPNQNQGYGNQGYPNQGGSGYPGESGYPNQGYPQQQQNQGYGGEQGFRPQNEYGQQSGYPQQGGGGYGQGGGGYQQGGELPGGFRSAQDVPDEHLPPGYNPATKQPYQEHELPPGASRAPDGYEGYVPEGMSHKEAHERGFIGTAGGGLLGAWLGHKFGHKHGHGFLGTVGGAGLGGWLGGKIL